MPSSSFLDIVAWVNFSKIVHILKMFMSMQLPLLQGRIQGDAQGAGAPT